MSRWKLLPFVLFAGVLCAGAPAAAQPAAAPPPGREVVFKQVANDLYFLFEFTSSNAVVLVTDEGVLVIDTRQQSAGG